MAKIKATLTPKSVVIEMPIDTLVYACEHNPEAPCRVIDQMKFAKFIADNIVDFDEDEAGNTALYRLLDALYEEAFIEDIVEEVDSHE